jgi:thioredoxin 1
MQRLLVACLCAEWCGTCRDYRPPMRQLALDLADEVEVAWVDIEDHDEVPDDLDIENFPTLLIARGDTVLFYGTVLPHAQTLVRLMQGALAGDLPPVIDARLDGLAARVRALGTAITRP